MMVVTWEFLLVVQMDRRKVVNSVERMASQLVAYLVNQREQYLAYEKVG